MAVHREDRGRSAKHSTLIDRGEIAITIVHVGAVDQIIVRAPTIAVDAEQPNEPGESATPEGSPPDPGNQHQHLGKVAAAYRQFL